jgi:hypothetical protein
MTLPEAKQGFVFAPRWWVMECHVSWAVRLRRVARDDARVPAILLMGSSHPDIRPLASSICR